MWRLCEGPIPAVSQKCPKELIPREDFSGKVTLCKSDYLVLYYSIFPLLIFFFFAFPGFLIKSCLKVLVLTLPCGWR